MTFDELKEKAHALPLKPGVYIMQDAKNEVIYVGKAKALKNRVSQYFANLASHTEKTRAMVGQIDHFDVIVADSEFEALILENSLIKRHQPRYNILLKDDKGYPYIRLTVKEDYPKFSLANRPAEDGARYFGPYGSRGATQGIIDALRLALRLPSCHKKFPRDIGRERPCLNYHMGQCDGYCRPGVDQGRYREAMDQAVRLLEESGYPCHSAGQCVACLIRRLRENDEFPHEIGLFLSYPPEDVRGFIENKACRFKCAGLWKVYGDEERAKELFRQYKRCTDRCCALWRAGSGLAQLAV